MGKLRKLAPGGFRFCHRLADGMLPKIGRYFTAMQRPGTRKR